MNRLITTFDEVPPYRTRFTSRSTDLNEEAMVLPYAKRVPPKSFVRSPEMKTEVSNSSRSARTPPSTFLFLHLHLSNSPEPLGSPPPQGLFVKLSFDDEWQPTVAGCSFTHHNEELYETRKLALAEGQCSAALSGRVIGPPDRTCQRLVVKKSSHRAIFFP